MGTIISGIIKAIQPQPGEKLTDIYKYRHTIKTLPGIFDAIVAMTSALKSLQNIAPDGDITKVKTMISRFAALFDETTTGSLKTALKNVANLPKYTYKGTKKAVKSFADMIDDSIIPLSNALKKFYNTGFSEEKATNYLSGWIKGGTGEGQEAGRDFGTGIMGLMKTFEGFKKPGGLTGFTSTLSTIYGLVVNWMVPFSQLLKDNFSEGKFDKNTFDLLNRVEGFITGGKRKVKGGSFHFGTGIFGLMKTLGEVKTPSIANASNAIMKLAMFFLQMKSLVGIMKKLEKSFGVKKGVTATGGFMGLGASGGKPPEVGSKVNPGLLAMAIGNTIGAFVKFEKIAGFSPQELDPAAALMMGYADRFLKIANSLNAMDKALVRTVRFAERKVTPDKLVEAAAKNIEKLGVVFQSLDELIVDTTMYKVAEALRGGDTVKVQHNGLTVKMKVTVNIEARELAASLSDEHGHYFEINQDRQNPLLDSEFN